jgi:hypothetical protein
MRGPWIIILQQTSGASGDPILKEDNLILAAAMLLVLALAAGVCFTILFKSNPDLFEVARASGTLHLVTVLAVVLSTTLLSLERVLTGEVTASILSGIVGYVLGSIGSKGREDKK